MMTSTESTHYKLPTTTATTISVLQNRPKRQQQQQALLNPSQLYQLEESNLENEQVNNRQRKEDDHHHLVWHQHHNHNHHFNDGEATTYSLPPPAPHPYAKNSTENLQHRFMYSYNKSYLQTPQPHQHSQTMSEPTLPGPPPLLGPPQSSSFSSYDASIPVYHSQHLSATRPAPNVEANIPDTEDLDNQEQSGQQSTLSTVSHHVSKARISHQTLNRFRGRAVSSDGGPFFKPTRQMRVLETLERNENFVVRIQSWIDKGFFMADNDWTCYRRNYFQVSASFTGLTNAGRNLDLPCLVYDENNPEEILRTITSFYIGVVARSAHNNREIELVQHTAKRDKGPQSVPAPRLCPITKIGASASVVSFDRLQFKQATANNGRRRATQQYHVLVVQLHGRTADGMDLIVAESESASLVVRGRAPGHYQTHETCESPQ